MTITEALRLHTEDKVKEDYLTLGEIDENNSKHTTEYNTCSMDSTHDAVFYSRRVNHFGVGPAGRGVPTYQNGVVRVIADGVDQTGRGIPIYYNNTPLVITEAFYLGTEYEYKFYDSCGNYLFSKYDYSSRNQKHDEMIRYLKPIKKNVIDPIPNVISYKRCPRNKIFINTLANVDKTLITDKYELYDCDYVMVNIVIATENEIDEYIDKTCKLRPIKVVLEQCDNYTNITYYGIDELKLHFIKRPFVLDKTSNEIFDCDRLDKKWCYQNVNRIKIIVDKVNHKKRQSRCIIS